MFVHAAPEEASANETISTLNFARRVSEITLGVAKRNMDCVKVFEAQEAANKVRVSSERKLAEMTAQLAAKEEANRAMALELAALQEQLAIAKSAGSPASGRSASGGRPAVPPLNMSRVVSHPVATTGAGLSLGLGAAGGFFSASGGLSGHGAQPPITTPRSIGSASARRYSLASEPSGYASPQAKTASQRHLERMAKAKERKESPMISNFDRLHASRASVSRAGFKDGGSVASGSSSAMRASVALAGLPPLSRVTSPLLRSSRGGSARSAGIGAAASLRASHSARSSSLAGISEALKAAAGLAAAASGRRSAPGSGRRAPTAPSSEPNTTRWSTTMRSSVHG